MEILSDFTSRIKVIEEQLILVSHKSLVFNEINQLDAELSEIKQLQNKINEIITQSNAVLQEEYDELKENISSTTRLMLFAIQEIEKTATTNNNEKSPQFLHTRAAHTPQSQIRTPLSAASRMGLNMYSKSPLIKKKTKSLMFTDFEAEIRQEDFDKIPSYSRGRITMNELQNFLNNVLIKCFNAKYEIFYKNRACLSTKDFNLQKLYHSQESYFEGEYFITMGDLAQIQNRNVDKKEEKYLQNLRFLRIIREGRQNSATCYIWMNKV